MSKITTDIKYSLKETFRDRINIFWMFIFPIVLFLLFGYIFGGQSDSITLYYQDNDGSTISNTFIQSLDLPVPYILKMVQIWIWKRC